MAEQQKVEAEVDTDGRDGEWDQLEAKNKIGDQRPSPPDKMLDVKSFLETVGDHPVFTLKIIEHAASQLKCAQEGKVTTLIDCYGDVRTINVTDGLEVE